tara:strand:+ start:285 stop:2483 length:2199 start_codon:yes stop_codon:yes gene_type:complete
MPELVKQTILVPLDGLSHEHETDGTVLGEHTLNFYPDGEGYLVNYPGKTEYFKSTSGLPVKPDDESAYSLPDSPGSVGSAINVYTTPPTGKFTRIRIYRDSAGQQHIVFVKGNQFCVVEGNGYRVLYTFVGVTRDGASYPDIEVHQNRLLIANLGDPVLTWDGFQDVVPLGVTEIPDPPTVSVGLTPWYTTTGQKKEDGNIVTVGNDYRSYELIGGMWTKYGYWGNPGIWYSGPIKYEPGGHYHGLHSPGDYHDPANWNDTSWRWKVQYFDRYGNKGPVSAATQVVTIPKNKAITVKPGFPETSSQGRVSLADWDGKSWSTVYWRPPKNDWHIAGCILYKTLDLHPEKANSQEVFYRDYTQNNVNCTRHTSISGDSTLANSAILDTDVGGPPSTDLIASWGSRVIMRDPVNKEKMLYSDQSNPGQFRPSHVYKARDTIEALLPLGDRLLIVTQSTSEILYYTGDGSIAHLETHENKGSYYGRSFAVFGDQAFGLFNDGFFLFNGQTFAPTKSPYFLEGDYIDRWHDVQNSVVQGEWYFLSIRKEMTADENNFVLMCHLPTSRWFQVEESVRDMAVSGEYVLGVSDSIYFMYRGNDYGKSTIHVRGLMNKAGGVMRESTLSGLSLFLEPASKSDVTVIVTGSNEFDKRTGEAVSYPSRSTVTKDIQYYPYYNDGVSTWNSSEWVAPNDFHIEVDMRKNVTAFKHDIRFEFEGPQKIKAIGIEFGVGTNIAPTE